jgi:hypothetical protein
MTTNINTILAWFKTGKKPTQAQFWASWQSFWHKDEMIPQSNINNLTDVLNAKTENDQFNAHESDPNAHPQLFGKVRYIQNRKFLVFKHPDNSDPNFAYALEINDLVMGYVGNIWITGIYLGGDITQIENFDVSTRIN